MMRFNDPELEAGFQRQQDDTDRVQLRRLLLTYALLGVVGAAFAGAGDTLVPLIGEVAPEFQRRIMLLDLIYVSGGSLLLVLGLPRLGRFQQPAVALYLGSYPVIAVWPLLLAPSIAAGPAFPLMVMQVLVIYLLSRLRFSLATLSACFASLFFSVVGYGVLHFPLNPMPIQLFLLLVTNVIGMSGAYTLESYARRSFLDATDLAKEKERSEALLRNILPEPVVDRLKQGEGVIADRYEAVTLLFADLVGFTPWSHQHPPEVVVSHLNELFSTLDGLTTARGVEKIKTIGDAYVAAAGLPGTRDDHAVAVAELALDMQQALQGFNAAHGVDFALRVGIHTGPVVAGVIGRRRLAYDLWGDTVNLAARMEQHGVAGRVQISPATAQLLKEHFALSSRGSIEIKGLGPLEVFLLAPS